MNLRLVFWRCPFAFCLPGKISIFALSTAGMLKLVDKQDLGSCALCVWVRVPLPAPTISLSHFSEPLPERCRSLPKGIVSHLANLTCSVYCSMACQPSRFHTWRLGVAKLRLSKSPSTLTHAGEACRAYYRGRCRLFPAPSTLTPLLVHSVAYYRGR